MLTRLRWTMSKYPCRLQEDNMRRVNAEPHLLSVVPGRRPCLLIMCKLAGVHVTVLYDQKAGTLSWRCLYVSTSKSSSASLFSARSTTATDVWCRRSVGDEARPSGTGALDRRALAVRHDPQPLSSGFLLPVRVEVRKYFGYSQLVEVMDLARGLPFARHLSQAHAAAWT
jgi:hypothetical protein